MNSGLIVEVLIIVLMGLVAWKGYLIFTGKSVIDEKEKDRYTLSGILATAILGLMNILLSIDPKLKDQFGTKEKAEKL